MTYRELQQALKTFKAQGLTNIRLNSKKVALQAEYERLTATNEDQDLLEVIENLDNELGGDNYLPIYELRSRVNLTREELDSALLKLESEDKIELSVLAEATLYTQEQINDGIAQKTGGVMFFIVRL